MKYRPLEKYSNPGVSHEQAARNLMLCSRATLKAFFSGSME
jgi:hypothetical protein